MAKIVKFDLNDNNEEKQTQDQNQSLNEKDLLRISLENYIISNFAVKNILGIDFIYKINKNDIGILGRVSYEHKRKPGIFVADYIAKGYKQKDKYVIDILAFELGEPELYAQILNMLKAKKTLPEDFAGKPTF